MLSNIAVNTVLGIKAMLHNTPLNIVLTTHHRPDGDAMGSTLGLYHYLIQYHHKVTIMPPNDGGNYLHFLPGYDKVVCYFEDNPELGTSILQEADVIFSVDYSQLSRVNAMGAVILQSNAKKVMIDHHIDPQEFSDYQLWDEHAAAACELVYYFIETLGDTDKINATVAECLYTGIVTDTGSFRFPATKPSLHRLVANLMETGFLHHKIHEELFSSSSLERLRFLGYCLCHKLVVLPEYKTAYLAISAKELEEYNVQTGETEGLVNYALSIAGVRFAVLIIDRTLKIKLSFRSIGDFAANEFAKHHFKGGGHFNAAGGESEEALEQVVERFLSLLPQYKERLLG